MRQLQWIALATLIALALGIGYFLGRGIRSATTGAEQTIDTSSRRIDSFAPQETIAHSPADRSAHEVLARPLIPLPPSGTPLTQIFDGLKARSDAGDGQAASRLYHDLETCRRWRAEKSMVAELVPNLLDADTTKSSPEELEQTERWLGLTQQKMDFVRKNSALCTGTDLDQLDETVPAMLAAARTGNTRALDCYLSLDIGTIPGRLMDHPEWLSQYKQNAAALTQTALEHGDWRVVRLLQYAYSAGSSGSDLLGRALGADPEPEQQYRYYRLERLGASGDYAKQLDVQHQWPSTLSAEQIAAADAWAQDTYTRYFDGTSSNELANWASACPEIEN